MHNSMTDEEARERAEEMGLGAAFITLHVRESADDKFYACVNLSGTLFTAEDKPFTTQAEAMAFVRVLGKNLINPRLPQ